MVVQYDLFGNIVEVKENKKSQSKSHTVKRIDTNIKHIYRLKTLDKLYSMIYEKLDINIFETKDVLYIGMFIAYPDERQAEIIGSQNYDIKTKIKLHIKAWRTLCGEIQISEKDVLKHRK